MDRLECAGVLDAQARQRIDVEEAPVVDVAGSEPPMTELVVLTFEQMVQRKRWRGAIRPSISSVCAGWFAKRMAAAASPSTW